MSIYFCAVDASINCIGISILELVGEKIKIIDKTTLKIKKTKYANRFHKKIDMYQMFMYWLEPRIDDISFFIFEGYSYGSPGHLADLGEMNGLLKLYLYENEKPIDEIPPSSVKKIVSGNGHAKKPVIAESIKKFLIDGEDIVFKSYDESDSVAVGIAYALTMLEIIDE